MIDRATTVCRAWVLRRRDGVEMGFTDHDCNLVVDGVACRASSGMSAGALQLGTGLAVDNAGAEGALSDAGLREADVAAGRWDGAAVSIWRVDWTAPEGAEALFRGTLGEIVRAGGAFRAELRGLAEALNRPRGRVFSAQCGAKLGDAACGVRLDGAGLREECAVVAVEREGRALVLDGAGAREAGWFARGRLRALDGSAGGLEGWIKADRPAGTGRRVELWAPLGAVLDVGDRVRIEAGCDGRWETCGAKFGNAANFRGFPHMPGDDWMMTVPAAGRGL